MATHHLLAMATLAIACGHERACPPCDRSAPADGPVKTVTPSIIDAAEPKDDCHRRQTFEHFLQNRSSHDFFLPDDAQQRYRAKWVDAELERLAAGDRVVELATAATAKVTAALAKRDYAALAKLVHARGLCVLAAKGAGCRWMRADELARCATSARKESWSFDSGAPTPNLSCDEAMRAILFGRDFATATPKVNCFPEYARGNNAGSVINADVPTDFYVELYAPEIDGPKFQPWRALWLHFAIEDIDPKLIGVQSEYWGI